ncbi:MAG: PTS sugar transporter subunit IIB [Bacillota bacterium]
MRVVALCGMGFGTSLMLKMTIGDIFRAHGIKADVQAWDLGSFKGQAADIVVAPQDMKRHLKDYQGRVVLINNLTDRREIEEKLLPLVRELLA